MKFILVDNAFFKKYSRILESIEDVAECVDGELILIGGTALALFYLKHRVSIDLDFVPVNQNTEDTAKEKLKGALSKKGYRTQRTTYANQFIVQFEDCSVKVEIFTPEREIKQIQEFSLGSKKIKVASIEDLLAMKQDAYYQRLEARDLYDIVFLLKKLNRDPTSLIRLLLSYGKPKNISDLQNMVSQSQFLIFEEVLKNATA